MQRLTNFITCALLTFSLSNCQHDKNLTGIWKPFEVKIWNSYHSDSLLVNLTSKQIYFNHENTETLALMTPRYKDSLLKMLSISYLNLDNNGSFIMEDYAFFTQALDDTNWHKTVVGKWHINMDNTTLNLTQQNGLTKCYKVLNFENKKLIIGELFECQGKPITEISLNR